MGHCIECINGKVVTVEDNSIKLFCKGEGTGVNSFDTCREFEEKQCTLCVNEKLDPTTDICFSCMRKIDRPNFILSVAE